MRRPTGGGTSTPRCCPSCPSSPAPRGWPTRSRAPRRTCSAEGEVRRLHYLSVPPRAALAVVHMLGEAGLAERSRIVMEKPFGTDLESAKCAQRRAARGLRRGADLPHRPLPGQGGGAEHPGVPLRQRPLRADLEPQLHRPRADRRARDAGAGDPRGVLRGHRRLPRHGGHPPVPGAGVHGDGAADRAGAGADQRGEDQGVPVHAAASTRRRRRARAVRRLPRARRRRPTSRTPRPSSRSRSRSTTGAGPACRSSCAPARSWPRAPASSRSPSRSRRGACSRAGSGVGLQGPDHLTFDLADQSRMSLSFYGKRPGPGHAAGQAVACSSPCTRRRTQSEVLEAYERLILDAMRGDHTLFTTADGIERLWELSEPLLDDPPPVRLVRAGHLGAERDPPADRPARLAAAVRAGLARPQRQRRLSLTRRAVLDTGSRMGPWTTPTSAAAASPSAGSASAP